MRLIADIHERESGIPAELARLGVDVEERQLEAGDYLLGNVALIERKSDPDLHQTVCRGRFWAQVGKLRRSARWPYLLIEGRSLYDGCLPAEAVRGLVIAVCDLGITVCRTEDVRDSAAWIRRIATRRDAAPSRDRPVYAQRPQRSVRNSPAEQALSAAPGVSTATAHALLARFGTLLNVLSASEVELGSVPGVRPGKAAEITALAHGTSHSGVSRNGRRLST